MELTKDVYFNTDKLIANTKIKISYTGKFYQENNEKVYLHYGYDKDWNNINELEMNKTDLGYQVELDLLAGDTLNFCFKNQNNEWDNNFGQNYIFSIEKKINNASTATTQNNFTFFGKAFSNNAKVSTQNSIIFTPTNIEKPINNVAETSIAVVPTGFNYWTKKIKETVWKYFAYVPKLVSGNYKRNISDGKK